MIELFTSSQRDTGYRDDPVTDAIVIGIRAALRDPGRDEY